MPYIENFALRLVAMVVVCIAAVNLAVFIKATVTHESYVFDLIKCLLFPGALGAFAAVMWKPVKK
jgi:hypothetical protein